MFIYGLTSLHEVWSSGAGSLAGQWLERGADAPEQIQDHLVSRRPNYRCVCDALGFSNLVLCPAADTAF
jgi:hypothetical protein